MTNGTIGNIENACQDRAACSRAASLGGSISAIRGSCTTAFACYYAAFESGSIGDISNSCLGYDACSRAARLGGSISAIRGSCTTDFACLNAASEDGSIGDISNSCMGESACEAAAISNGTIGNIDNACQDVSACQLAASGLTIPGLLPPADQAHVTTINECCNAGNQCYNSTSDSKLIDNDLFCGEGVFRILVDEEIANPDSTFTDNQLCYTETALKMTAASVDEELYDGVTYGYTKAADELDCASSDGNLPTEICELLAQLILL